MAKITIEDKELAALYNERDGHKARAQALDEGIADVLWGQEGDRIPATNEAIHGILKKAVEKARAAIAKPKT